MTGKVPTPEPSSLPPLVDRQEEVARIAEALDAAERGEGQLLLLRGEAGCGKTRLLREAAAWRLIGLLFERPREDWSTQVAAIAGEVISQTE